MFQNILNEISKRLSQDYNDVSLNASSSVVGLWLWRPHRIGKTAGALDMHFPNREEGKQEPVIVGISEPNQRTQAQRLP